MKPEPNSEAYLPDVSSFLDGKLTRMPNEPWARDARYTPGQVWCPEGVSRNDVNPRPLSPLVPSNGLIGCFSGDGKQLMATAWEPYQELFQGVIVCLHSDFRIGGLKPGQSRTIRGKIYLMPADEDALLARYRLDFPEHQRQFPSGHDGFRPRKLIEFGWDEPDLEFLVTQSCGDGTIALRRLRLSRQYLGSRQEIRKPDMARVGRQRIQVGRLSGSDGSPGRGKDCRGQKGKGFAHNFLRVNVTPGNLDWFDDHRAIMANARLAGQIARQARCDGILLDTEQYEGQLFDFSKQRDATRRSWMEYASRPGGVARKPWRRCRRVSRA